MDRRVFLWCVLIVLAVIVLGKEFGLIGEKMTPVEAAAEPLVSELPVGRPPRTFEEISMRGFLLDDTERVNRNFDAAMTEFERIQMDCIKRNDWQTEQAINPLFERLKAVLEHMKTGDYDAPLEDKEISDIRRELRKMGLVVDRASVKKQ